MGNEQSTPTTRRQNRLSKPRTNTTQVTGTPLRPNELATRDSVVLQLEGDGLGNHRYSSAASQAAISPAIPDVYIQDPMSHVVVPEKKKRMSLFRSKSSQAKIQQLDIANGVEIDRLNETPVRKPILKMPERWSRSNSLVDQGENSYAPPIAKNHRWSRTNSLVGEEVKPSQEKYGSVAAPNRWSRSNSLVDKEKYGSVVAPNRWSRSNSLVDKEKEVEVKYEFTPPIPRVPVLRTPEQRAQVER